MRRGVDIGLRILGFYVERRSGSEGITFLAFTQQSGMLIGSVLRRTPHDGLLGIAVGSSGDGVLKEAEKHFDRPVPGPLTFRHSGGMQWGARLANGARYRNGRRFGRTRDASEDRVAGLRESMPLTGDRPVSFAGAPY